MRYDARVPQSKNVLGTKSSTGISGSARKQGRAVQKSFAVFDIDGTLIRWQLYHAIADTLAKRGHIDEQTYTTIRKARMAWKKREHSESFRAYEQQLVQAYDKALQALSVEQFEAAAEAVFQEYKDQVYTYTRQLLVTLKKRGYILLAISGSQSEIVERIAAHYGFDDCVGSTYRRAGNRFTGEKNFAAQDKAALLKKLVAKHGATVAASIAVGDSESDIAMLAAVEQPIAFNPTRKLFEHATQHGWKVVVERKNMVYELESRRGAYILVQAKR